MKIPSIIKTPRHNRFNFAPRHYDPVKEEIEEKIRAFKANKEFNKNESSSISAAFSKRQRKNSNASAMQLVIAIALMVTCVGWLFYGNQIFYSYMLLFPIYFYWRIKNRKSRD